MPKSLIGKVVNAARSPIPHGSQWSRGGSYGSRPSDKLTQLNAMGGQSTLFAIIQLISTGTSSAQWHMYRKKTDGRQRYAPTEGDDAPRQEVTQHQALRLWNQPNDFFTGHDFQEVGWQFMELVGEWYWVLDRGPSGTGVPTEMWPVRPDRMEPVPDANDFLKGWIYTGPNGEAVPLMHEEVIQLRYPDPGDFYRGMSAVQSLLADIDAARFTAEWSRNFFLNSATPGGIVQFSKRLSDPEFEEFVTRWREQHQGVARGHRVGILEQGAIWIPNTYSMRDMQFNELRSMSREVLREAYRIHQAMLGLSDDVNRANAQTAEEVHIQWQEVPRLTRTRNVLNGRFLDMFGATGQGVEFDFDDPTPVNELEQSEAFLNRANGAAVLVKQGYDMGDVLKAAGLPDMKWKIPEPPAPRPALPSPPGADQSSEDDATLAAIGNGIRKALRSSRMAFTEPDFEAMAALLRSELPALKNGHRKELV